jgi:hypothetical protein
VLRRLRLPDRRVIEPGPPEHHPHGCRPHLRQHAPVTSFFGNWLWWQASALAYNVARWLRVLALPRAWHHVRGKRLRLGLLNVPDRVVRSARRLYLRLPAAYQHAAVFIAALERIRALPAFA